MRPRYRARLVIGRVTILWTRIQSATFPDKPADNHGTTVADRCSQQPLSGHKSVRTELRLALVHHLFVGGMMLHPHVCGVLVAGVVASMGHDGSPKLLGRFPAAQHGEAQGFDHARITQNAGGLNPAWTS